MAKDPCFRLAHVMYNLQLWDLEELLNTPQENNHEENEAVQADSDDNDDEDDDEMDIDIGLPKSSGNLDKLLMVQFALGTPAFLIFFKRF